jgi:hypothetical protein
VIQAFRRKSHVSQEIYQAFEKREETRSNKALNEIVRFSCCEGDEYRLALATLVRSDLKTERVVGY